MDKWSAFLNSLASKGGNILVLLVVSAFLGVAVLHVIHAGETAGAAGNLIVSSFAGAFGALLLSLQNGGGQRKADGQNGNGGANPAGKP